MSSNHVFAILFSIRHPNSQCVFRLFECFPSIFVSCVAGIKSVFADYKSERVIVETSLNSSTVQRLIEGTGRRAVLQGLGSGKGESKRRATSAVILKAKQHVTKRYIHSHMIIVSYIYMKLQRFLR